MNLGGATEGQILRKDTQTSDAFRVTADGMNDWK